MKSVKLEDVPLEELHEMSNLLMETWMLLEKLRGAVVLGDQKLDQKSLEGDVIKAIDKVKRSSEYLKTVIEIVSSMRFLVAEPIDGFREFLLFFLEMEFKVQVFFAASVQSSIVVLSSVPDLSCVISASKLLDGSSSSIVDHLEKNKTR